MTYLRAAGTILCLLSLATIRPRSLHPQVPDTTLGDTLLVASRLIPPYPDTITLALHRYGQYRIAILPADTRIRVLPAGGKTEALVVRVRLGRNGHSSVFEVSPFVTDTHRLALSTTTLQDTVSVWVWSDRAREADFRTRREREWGIGLTVGAGYHSGYRTALSDPSAKASADFQAGVLLGSSGRLSLMVGVLYDGRYTGSHSVTGVIGEPRVRLLRTQVAGRVLMVEALGRIAQGNSATITVDPSYYGLGPLLTYHLDQRPGSRGWRLELQATENWVRNIPLRGQRFTRVGLGVSWLP